MLAAELEHTEALMKTNADFAQWVRSRGGHQAATAALFAVFIYTDDPIFMVVGALRMTRALRIWTILYKQIGLLMAIETKRQCDTHQGSGLRRGLRRTGKTCRLCLAQSRF